MIRIFVAIVAMGLCWFGIDMIDFNISVDRNASALLTAAAGWCVSIASAFSWLKQY